MLLLCSVVSLIVSLALKSPYGERSIKYVLYVLYCIDGFEGCCFALGWSETFVMPSYMPLILPVSAAVWMLRLAVCWTLLRAVLNVLRVFSLGEHLYSVRAAHFASMTGVISADFATNQSELREVFFLKMARADV